MLKVRRTDAEGEMTIVSHTGRSTRIVLTLFVENLPAAQALNDRLAETLRAEGFSSTIVDDELPRVKS
jgi:hypothetical protein